VSCWFERNLPTFIDINKISVASIPLKIVAGKSALRRSFNSIPQIFIIQPLRSPSLSPDSGTSWLNPSATKKNSQLIPDAPYQPAHRLFLPPLLSPHSLSLTFSQHDAIPPKTWYSSSPFQLLLPPLPLHIFMANILAFPCPRSSSILQDHFLP
jgi:hypothetical protein